MKLQSPLIALSLCASCLALALSYVIRRHADPCERLARLTTKVVNLQAVRPRPYRFTDHLVAVLHNSSSPFADYFFR
jgi:hypothetical protein